MAMTSTVSVASRDQAHRRLESPLSILSVLVRLSWATLGPRYGRSYIAPGTVNGAMNADAVAIFAHMAEMAGYYTTINSARTRDIAQCSGYTFAIMSSRPLMGS